jgi:hypothetical protein
LHPEAGAHSLEEFVDGDRTVDVGVACDALTRKEASERQVDAHYYFVERHSAVIVATCGALRWRWQSGKGGEK